MATTNRVSSTKPISTSSYETALCVVPPAHLCQDVDRLRALYDKGYGRWPPHINLIYPFVAPENLPQAKDQILSELRISNISASPEVCLNRADHFRHRNNSTVILRQGEDDNTSALEHIRTIILKALGQPVSSCNLHLTLGQSEDASETSLGFLLGKAKLLSHLSFPIISLAILIREVVPGQEKSLSRMRLWGTVDITDTLPSLAPRHSEFWISNRQATKTEAGSETGDEDEAVSPSSSPLLNREVQTGTTYQIDAAADRWLPCQDSSNYPDLSPPSSITVSSYNVLIDSEYPPARDRDPLLLRTILSNAASADVLVLQEVSDDFLSYLLSDHQIRSRYNYVSHGPPSQSDLGPLPSLRNVIFLSRWHFSWELVPFHRRHKSALVAKFETFAASESNLPLSFIVAGIHLTCGLTDGSVAAKKTQFHNLKNHLAHKYDQYPWIVAGDFNITTSTYTIETALKNKSISQQTVRSLSDLEASITEAGFSDSWAISRLQGTEYNALLTPEDLFEGEDGATFNPRENVLAAATSGTSNNRPQRYDRILVRLHDTFQIQGFNYFGLPEQKGGVQSVPSDHSGIRATMGVVEKSGERLLSSAVTEQQILHPQSVPRSLSDGTSLNLALENHGMIPTDDEIRARQEAFRIIKESLLGSSNEEETSMSEIPMVIVPVGSYALGTWTSASDIDCLCIGSISSKTFFRLARQRIQRAAPQGVRFLRRVEATTGTMFELSVNGVNMDLQYCPAAKIVERWMDFPSLQQSDPIFNLSMLSLRKLKPYRDINYIKRTLPSIQAFRLAYRCIKLWAVQRGIYSSKFGFLGGIHITLMLSWVCKRLARETASASPAELVTTFFHHFANFDWKNEMLYDAFFHQHKPRYHRSAREPMVVLGFHAPNTNVAHTSSIAGLNVLVKEFSLAHDRLSHDGTTLETFFAQPEGTSSGMVDFLRSYQSYIQINIQYWGRSLPKGKSLVGWVESRCLLHVVDINKVLPSLDIRIWPARFTNDQPAETETDYQGCYLIGLSKQRDSETYDEKDKVAAKQTLDKCLDRFQTQLQTDERNYDPSTTWVSVELVKPSDVKSFVLDQREWGDYIPDLEPDSEDEEEAEDSDTIGQETSRALPIRAAPSSTTAPQTTNKLRPASDVLHRLRWDPNLDPSDYIVGYEDRFLGAKETGLERWKTEQTDDEFIPQHRILYFKRRGDGVVVWERRSRVDLVFGSGAGAG